MIEKAYDHQGPIYTVRLCRMRQSRAVLIGLNNFLEEGIDIFHYMAIFQPSNLYNPALYSCIQVKNRFSVETEYRRADSADRTDVDKRRKESI